MALLYIIIVGFVSIGLCILVAALIANPQLVLDLISCFWRLLGHVDSPFFWMFTLPALILVVAFLVYALWLHIKVGVVRSP